MASLSLANKVELVAAARLSDANVSKWKNIVRKAWFIVLCYAGFAFLSFFCERCFAFKFYLSVWFKTSSFFKKRQRNCQNCHIEEAVEEHTHVAWEWGQAAGTSLKIPPRSTHVSSVCGWGSLKQESTFSLHCQCRVELFSLSREGEHYTSLTCLLMLLVMYRCLIKKNVC